MLATVLCEVFMNVQDSCYRRLFSYRVLLQALARAVLAGPLLQRWRLDQAQPASPVYVGPDLQNRQADLVWNIPARQGGQNPIALLIEHQSQPDHAMPLRMLTYTALHYQALQRAYPRRKEKLPWLLPVILYSGRRPWPQPVRIQNLIDAAPSPWLECHRPRQDILLFDQKKQVLTGLLPPEDPLMLICQMEHNQGLVHLADLLHTAHCTLPDPCLQRDLAIWVNRVLLPRHLPHLTLPRFDQLLEIQAMLIDHSYSWTHQWLAQGRQQGIQKGIQVGRLQSHRSLLSRQMRHKFGRLSQAHWELLTQADLAQLQAWSIRLLQAQTLEEVFSPSPDRSTKPRF